MDTSVESEFTEFVVRRSHALLRVAYALTGDAHAAEDLVQQALAKAFVHWRRIHGEAEPYVKRIIYHDSASRWRRRSHRAETTMAAPPDRDRGARCVARHPPAAHARAALLGLPPRQRAVLVLRYLEDLSVEATAEILGRRPGTVASQAARALAKLRDLIPDDARVIDLGVARVRRYGDD